MLVIRFTRTGRRNLAMYRIVVAEKSRAVKRQFQAIVGHYNPHTKEVVLKKDEIEQYIKNGAQPSNSVARLLKKEGIKLPDWVEITEKKKAPKKQEEKPDEGVTPPEDKTKDKSEEPEAKEEAKPEDKDQPESKPEESKQSDSEKDTKKQSKKPEAKEKEAPSEPAKADQSKEDKEQKA